MLATSIAVKKSVSEHAGSKSTGKSVPVHAGSKSIGGRVIVRIKLAFEIGRLGGVDAAVAASVVPVSDRTPAESSEIVF